MRTTTAITSDKANKTSESRAPLSSLVWYRFDEITLEKFEISQEMPFLGRNCDLAHI